MLLVLGFDPLVRDLAKSLGRGKVICCLPLVNHSDGSRAVKSHTLRQTNTHVLIHAWNNCGWHWFPPIHFYTHRYTCVQKTSACLCGAFVLLEFFESKNQTLICDLGSTLSEDKRQTPLFLSQLSDIKTRLNIDENYSNSVVVHSPSCRTLLFLKKIFWEMFHWICVHTMDVKRAQCCLVTDILPNIFFWLSCSRK